MRTTIALACFFASVSFGQMQMMSTRVEGGGSTMTVTMRPAPRFLGQVVTGAPFSGEQVSEHVQTLADGTHITQRQGHEKMYRDSQGRTRTERSLMGGMQAAQKGEFVIVEIRDPVAGFYYEIDDQNKVAHRMAIEAPPQRQRSPVSPEQRAAAAKMRAENSTEKLGSDNMEGVAVEGTRFTRTIPIGDQGNDRPIVNTNESWYSPDLKAVVLSKSSDPRYGDQTMRLTNISRAEPDPALFMPPAGYTVVDEKDSFSITVKRQ